MNYKKADMSDYEALLTIIGDESRVFGPDNIKEEYSHDELGGTEAYPDIVIIALHTYEVSRIMKYAYDNNIPVTVRGSGRRLP